MPFPPLGSFTIDFLAALPQRWTMPISRFCCLLLATGLSVPVPVAQAQTNSKPVLGSSVYQWDWIKSQAATNDHGSFARVFNSATATLNNLECHVTVLEPSKASHEPHHHPEEEVVIIREGTVEALINNEWKRVGPGSIVFNACNVTHDLRNVGTAPAVYHVLSWKSSLTPSKTTHTDTFEDSKYAAKDGIMGPLAMDWNSVAVTTTTNGFSRQFFDSRIATADELEFHATTVNPGQSSHSPSAHADAREEVIIVREGTVEAYVKGEWKRVGPGGVIFNASHEMQAVRNVGDTPATYFVLMWQSHAS